MKLDKKSAAWARRGFALELSGLEPGLIGSDARMERFRELRRQARFYRDLVVRAGHAQLKIRIIERPELSGNHMTVGLILELPLEGGSPELSNKAESAFGAFLKNAVAATTPKPARRRARRTKLA